MRRITRVATDRAPIFALVLAAAVGAASLSGCASGKDGGGRAEQTPMAIGTDAWTESKNGSVAISKDGDFWVGSTTKKNEDGFVRQVFRYKVNRLPVMGTSTPYWIRFAGKRETGQFTAEFDTRPRPVSRPSGTGVLDDETQEMGMVMPDPGVAVVTGTAPLISVKKATVSSAGTIFAIEANSTDWLLTVIATEGNHKVLIHFPEARTAPRELSAGESIRYGDGATTPNAGVMETGSAASIALRDYAMWIVNQTP